MKEGRDIYWQLSILPKGSGDSTYRKRISLPAIQCSDGHAHWYDMGRWGVNDVQNKVYFTASV